MRLSILAESHLLIIDCSLWVALNRYVVAWFGISACLYHRGKASGFRF
jgi:hypothetical protein